MSTTARQDELSKAAVRLRNAEIELGEARAAYDKLAAALARPVFEGLIADDWYTVVGRGNIAQVTMGRQPVSEIRVADHVSFAAVPDGVQASGVWRVHAIEVPFREVKSTRGHHSAGLCLVRVPIEETTS